MIIFGGVSSNYKGLVKKLNEAPSVLEDALRKANIKATLKVHEAAVKMIQDNSDGVTAIRSNPKRTVNVSNPGDPPNTDTGRLVQSIKFEFEDDGRKGRVGTNLKYGAWLEFGTKDMSARPWLSTALSMASKSIASEINKGINTGIAKAFGVKTQFSGVQNLLKSGAKSAKRGRKAAKKMSRKAKRLSRKISRSIKKRLR